MNYNKYKWFGAFLIGLFIVLAGYISFGLYLMDKEDRYGDFYYLLDEVQDDDILIYSTYQNKSEYKEYAIAKKSFFNVMIYDEKNTMPKAAYDWYDDYSIYRVKLYRTKKLNPTTLDIKEIQNSEQFKLIMQTY